MISWVIKIILELWSKNDISLLEDLRKVSALKVQDAANSTGGREPKETGLLSERAFDYVVDNICNGNFKPGQKVGERKIARQLGISQIPVREAMEKLWQRGWIDKFPKRGAFVKKFDIREVQNVFQIREVFETGCARLLAHIITPQQLDQLKELVDILQKTSENKEMEKYEEADMQFHKSIIRFIGNKRLDELFETVLLQSQGFFLSEAVRAAFSWGRDLEKLDFSSHERIYKALSDGDAERAVREVSLHIKGGCDFAQMVAKTQQMLGQ